jgi:vacuolar-type H+-ATPase subunit E/Vma4
VALADILSRIEEDADTEAFCVIDEARRKAEWIVEQAHSRAAERREQILEDARLQAERDRATRLALSRLHARDRSVTARRELAGRVLRRAEESIAALSDDEYADLIARRLQASARGGETVRIAASDQARLQEGLRSRLDGLTIGESTDDISHGALLIGDRTTVEVSPRALVAEQEDELFTVISQILFEGEE